MTEAFSVELWLLEMQYIVAVLIIAACVVEFKVLAPVAALNQDTTAEITDHFKYHNISNIITL